MAHRTPSVFVGLLLANIVSVIYAVRTPTHTVSAFCQRDSAQTLLYMFLTVDIAQDKPGEWRAISGNNGVVSANDCNINIYVKPALTTSVNTANNFGTCGSTPVYDNLGIKTGYRWKIRYREGPEEVYEVDAGKNRLYTITCPLDAPPNAITTAIIVTTPNLDQTIVPQAPIASLQALYHSTGTVVDSTGIAVGELYRLRATIDVSNLQYPRPTGAWVKRTILSSLPDFSSDVHIIIADNGCRNTDIWSPSDNFKLKTSQSTSSLFVHETGAASAWQPDTTDFVYFKAIYGFCFTTGAQECINPCAAARRRRRDVTEETEEEVVVKIKVYNPNKAEASTGLDSGVLIGVCIAAGIGLIILSVVCFIAIYKRRRRNKRPNQVKTKIPAEGFENKVDVPYMY